MRSSMDDRIWDVDPATEQDIKVITEKILKQGFRYSQEMSLRCTPNMILSIINLYQETKNQLTDALLEVKSLQRKMNNEN